MDFDTVGKNVPFKHKPFKPGYRIRILDSSTFYVGFPRGTCAC